MAQSPAKLPRTPPPQEQEERSFKLVSGHSIPAVGLGTWKTGEKASDSVYTAITEVNLFLSSIRNISKFNTRIMSKVDLLGFFSFIHHKSGLKYQNQY